MISFKRTNQGGAIRTYIVIGVLLAVATIGAARFVQQRGQQVRQEQAIALADSQDQAKSNQPTNNTAVNVPSSESDGTSAAGKGTSNAETTTAADNSQSAQQAGALPTTGPESGVQQIILSALMTGSAVAYFSSRKATRSSL